MTERRALTVHDGVLCLHTARRKEDAPLLRCSSRRPLNIHASLVVETDGNVNASDAIRGRGGGKKEKREM